MKETIEEQLRYLAQYAGGATTLPVLTDEDVEVLMPMIHLAMLEEGLTVRGQTCEYPHVIWALIWRGVVRPTVLSWIDDTKPEAWYRLMYATKDEVDAAMGEQLDAVIEFVNYKEDE